MPPHGGTAAEVALDATTVWASDMARSKTLGSFVIVLSPFSVEVDECSGYRLASRGWTFAFVASTQRSEAGTRIVQPGSAVKPVRSAVQVAFVWLSLTS